MLIAMSGDLDGAEKAIAEAEVLGASHGSVHMIRGQLALHRGDTRKAIEHLEQAVNLLPRSVAAYSLLAEAYTEDGQWDRYEIIFLVLQRYEGSRKPKRPSDEPIGMDVLLGGHRYGRRYDYADQAGLDSFSAPV
jgi:tetratricopeptide (TPR) repeat protein